MQTILRLALTFLSLTPGFIRLYANADINISTVRLPAANVNQGSSINIIYIAKAVVTSENLNFTSIQFTLSGSYDADDLSGLSI